MDKRQQAELFNDSFQRCLASEDFIDRFYDRFIRSDESIAKKFSATNMDNQKVMLKASLYTLMSASLGTPSALENLRGIGQVHSREQRDIPTVMYQQWLDSLLLTVKETDPHFDSRVEQAWQDTLRNGIAIMQEEY